MAVTLWRWSRGDCTDDYFSQTAGSHELDQRSAIDAHHGGSDATLNSLALPPALLHLDPVKESA